MNIRKLLLGTIAAILIGAPAHAQETDYICRVGHKMYPVTLLFEWATPDGPDIKDGGILKWRGIAYQGLKLGDSCKEEFTATHDGVTADLCMKTKGVASLTIGNVTFDCNMRK